MITAVAPPVIIPFIPSISSNPHREPCGPGCDTAGLVILGIGIALLVAMWWTTTRR